MNSTPLIQGRIQVLRLCDLPNVGTPGESETPNVYVNKREFGVNSNP